MSIVFINRSHITKIAPSGGTTKRFSYFESFSFCSQSYLKCQALFIRSSQRKTFQEMVCADGSGEK